jgi:chitodextrinase
VSFSWTASTDNIGVIGYDVYRNGLLIGGTSGTAFTNTGLTAGTTYGYTVRAKDAAGNVSASSSTLSVTTNAPPPPPPADTTPPSAPSSLTATAISTSQINLSWATSTDNVGVTGYDVYRNGSKILTTTATSMGDTGLSAGTTYTYYVQAKDAAGNVSVASPNASATTQTPVTIKTAPLYGVVVANTGLPIVGARVSLTVNGAKVSATTNSSGAYIINGIPENAYSVTYSAKRFKTQNISVVIRQPEVIQNVTLEPGGGGNR